MTAREHTSPIECDGGPHCQAPEHIHGCFAERTPKTTREDLGKLWGRIEAFCLERGWHAYLYVREDVGPNFGRVGVKVEQAGGYSFGGWGDTTERAIRTIVMQLERDGFDA